MSSRLRLAKEAPSAEYDCERCWDTGILEMDEAQVRKGMSMFEYIATCVVPCACARGAEQLPEIEKERVLWAEKKQR
jgi:hypothetical protein